MAGEAAHAFPTESSSEPQQQLEEAHSNVDFSASHHSHSDCSQRLRTADGCDYQMPQHPSLAFNAPDHLGDLLRQLEDHLAAQSRVPEQLDALQEVPRQMIAVMNGIAQMRCQLGKLEQKAEIDELAPFKAEDSLARINEISAGYSSFGVFRRKVRDSKVTGALHRGSMWDSERSEVPPKSASARSARSAKPRLSNLSKATSAPERMVVKIENMCDQKASEEHRFSAGSNSTLSSMVSSVQDLPTRLNPDGIQSNCIVRSGGSKESSQMARGGDQELGKSTSKNDQSLLAPTSDGSFKSGCSNFTGFSVGSGGSGASHPESPSPRSPKSRAIGKGHLEASLKFNQTSTLESVRESVEKSAEPAVQGTEFTDLFGDAPNERHSSVSSRHSNQRPLRNSSRSRLTNLASRLSRLTGFGTSPWGLASTNTVQQVRSLTRSASWPRPHGKHIRERYVLKPNSFARLVWDVIIIINTAFAGTILPLQLVYLNSRTNPFLDILLFWVIDMLWPIDVLVNLRTGFYADCYLVKDPCTICVAYAKRWLLLDIIASYPLGWVSRDTTSYLVVCLLKIPRLLQLWSRMHRVRVEMHSNELVPAYITLVIFLAVHILACGWRLAQRYDNSEYEGDASWATAYLADVYYIVMTITTVGYGDILATGNVGRLYTLFVMLLGSAALSGAISGVTHMSGSLFNNVTETRVGQVTRFMVRRSVPKDLQRQVQINLREHLHYQQSTAMDAELLTLLSPAMQRELSLSLLSHTVLRFPLFKDAPRSFVAELAKAHTWEQVLSGDLVAEEGHIVEDVVFVIHGCLRAWMSRKYDTTQLDVDLADLAEQPPCRSSAQREMTEEDGFEIPAGAWFGQSCLFSKERIYIASLVALTSCELALLAAKAYINIIHQYPRLWQQHIKLEQQINSGNISLDGLTYKEADGPIRKGNKAANMFRGATASTNMEHWSMWKTMNLSSYLKQGSRVAPDASSSSPGTNCVSPD